MTKRLRQNVGPTLVSAVIAGVASAVVLRSALEGVVVGLFVLGVMAVFSALFPELMMGKRSRDQRSG